MSIAEKFYREYFKWKYVIECRNKECGRIVVSALERSALPSHYKCDVCEQMERDVFEFDTKPSDIKKVEKFPKGSKLDKEDWKGVNMLISFHNQLLSTQKKFLKNGQIAVDKNRLDAHLKTVKAYIDAMDVIMTEKESNQRGKKIGQAISKLNYSVHTIKHFDLKIPLEDLNGKPIKQIDNEFLN